LCDVVDTILIMLETTTDDFVSGIPTLVRSGQNKILMFFKKPDVR